MKIDEQLAMESKWQKKWEESGAFEADAREGQPKFFLNVPYPYMNGYLHLGFGVTFLHAEILARHMRMRGYNVLMPQAFHCTGLPIVAAANRISEGEEMQFGIMRDMGIPQDEIVRFNDPVHWTKYFPPQAMIDLKSLGASVDWRRSFITTRLNPFYDSFVKWQFRKLKDNGFVRLGEHPVIWCPKDEAPVGDHDRLEGEGETPAEFVLLKFPIDGKFLLAATLRPETVYGQTNLWVNPDIEYKEVRVGSEIWVVSEEATRKLAEQKKDVEVVGSVSGRDFVGKTVRAPVIGSEIPVLPSKFIDQAKGTGIVTSVPSDAPDDWIALKDLQEDEKTLAEFDLDPDEIKDIAPIAIITSEGWGPLPAVEIVDRMGIENQMERDKLEKAKDEIYRTGYYTGVMNEDCGDISGMKVEEAKDVIKRKMIEAGEADILYEPSGEVICRCLTPAVVKLVRDQWFLDYGDPEWKKLTYEALEKMRLLPEISRRQFEYVVDWLREWACAHHHGLGTSLPWDENWVIESLSDSTIYMSYYTFCHLLPEGSADKVDDDFFDYVLFESGDAKSVAEKTGIDVETLDAMRNEFLYWYPFDLRNSGKDLVQNHLVFCIFNHVAIFPQESWPRAFGVNGFVKLEGQRMSKSHGIVTYIRHAIKAWGADVTRITLAQGGEGLDDPSFDVDFADSIGRKLRQWMRFALSDHETRGDVQPIDRWFRSVMNRAVGRYNEAMELLYLRTALKHAYFDLQGDWNWYLRRCNDIPNSELLADFVELQTMLLAPFVPHVCEEIWEGIGKEGFVSLARLPETDEDSIKVELEASEKFFRNTLDDVRQISRATGMTPARLVFYTHPEWMANMFETAVGLRKEGRLEVGVLMKEAMKDDLVRASSKQASKWAPKLVDQVTKMKPSDVTMFSQCIDEKNYLEESKGFLEREFKCEVSIFTADDPERHDPGSRATGARPWRPAIFIE
ncbi:MAG: leucine--tRNA ligase [Thermoplasmata archaeon]